MKIAATIARYLLGLIFLVFGLNKFFNFIPSGPMPTGVTGQFMGVMIGTKYIMMVGLFETVGGLLLLFCVRIRSIRSLGRMKPPAPESTLMVMERARMPG